MSRNRDKTIYREGAIAGIMLFAWWKDGVQYVGTTGRTLQEAVNEIDTFLPAPMFEEEEMLSRSGPGEWSHHGIPTEDLQEFHIRANEE